MQLTAILTLLATISAATAATCKVKVNNGGEITGDTYTYTIDTTGVPDRAGICGGLWDNLQCLRPLFYTTCDGDNGNLHWEFSAYPACDSGDVTSAWWRATKNQWGGYHVLIWG